MTRLIGLIVVFCIAQAFQSYTFAMIGPVEPVPVTSFYSATEDVCGGLYKTVRIEGLELVDRFKMMDLCVQIEQYRELIKDADAANFDTSNPAPK